MFKQYFSKSKHTQRLTAIMTVVVVAGIGTYILTSSHAATPYVAVSADTGALTSGAAKQTCSGASDGSCVVFGGGGGTTNTGVPWIGLNDFIGWGPPLTHQYLSDGFRWARISVDGSYAANNDIDAVLAPGCDDGMSSDSSLLCSAVVIVPDNAAEAMTWMTHYASYGSRLIWEFGNEQYLTQSGYTMTAQAYAQAYTAAYNAKHAAGSGITSPLLFMTTGDPCWSIAEDACTNGAELYLEKAMSTTADANGVKGVPNLQVDGFSTHTYGGADSNTSNDTNGVDALIAQHQDAVNHGFTNTPWYVTEWGVTLDPAQAESGASVNDGYYAPSYADQAADITSAYSKMVSYGDGTNGTWLKGIMYYQTHDDSTGWFGLITSPNSPSTDNAGEAAGDETACQSGQPPPPCGIANTPITLRPSYNALKAFLTNH